MGKSEKNIPYLNSDALHNRNCYAYFLQLKPVISNQIRKLLPEFAQLHSVMNEEYHLNYPYGDLYTTCIKALEEYIDKTPKEELKMLDNLILAIYDNNNSILEKNSAWINHLGDKIRPLTLDVGKKIEQKLKDISKINRQSPHDIGGIFNRVYSLFAQNFKPQYETNIPTIKNYSYKQNTYPTENRFSTQAQRHLGTIRVSKLFEHWLEIKANIVPEQQIAHIYFNNLGLDRKCYNVAGSKERELSLALQQLEAKPQLKILVITLPADDGLMNASDYKQTENQLSTSSVFNELLAIAQGKGHPSGVTDFYISDKARELIFKNETNQELELKQLLNNSFKAIGIENAHLISTAQKQAVWMHFIKYELTNHILLRIKPKSYNFSCKDSIDRGAVSSTYYNLLKSFSLECPMLKDEFERSLDAAAANVKGRGMNFHRKTLWNAINYYVNANYDILFKDNKKSWLIYWRDMNCPHSQVESLIHLRLKQVCDQLMTLNEDQKQIKKHGLKLLNKISELNTQNVSGKRLLLEAISRTSSIVSLPSINSINKYKNLANELKINYPTFHIISGIMEAILGVILYFPSLGYSEKLIKHGYSRANTGFYYQNKLKLCKEMNQFALAEQTEQLNETLNL